MNISTKRTGILIIDSSLSRNAAHTKCVSTITYTLLIDNRLDIEH